MGHKKLISIGFLWLFILLSILPITSYAILPVEDVPNEINTRMTYLNTVQSLLKEAMMIQNQIQQLQYDAKNSQGLSLQQWDNAANALMQLSNAMNQMHALTYVNNTQFNSVYPGYNAPATNQYAANYQIWSQANQATMNGTLSQLNESYQQQSQEAQLDQLLATQAQNPTGRMQAIQVGNEIAAEEVAQLQKIKATLMTETNAIAEFNAYQSQKDAVAQQSVDAVVQNGNYAFPAYQSNAQFGPLPTFGGGV